METLTDIELKCLKKNIQLLSNGVDISKISITKKEADYLYDLMNAPYTCMGCRSKFGLKAGGFYQNNHYCPDCFIGVIK